jgi:hypothetical protein
MLESVGGGKKRVVGMLLVECGGEAEVVLAV